MSLKLRNKLLLSERNSMNNNSVSLPAPLELNIDLTDEQFFQLCQNNRDLRFERTADKNQTKFQRR